MYLVTPYICNQVTKLPSVIKMLHTSNMTEKKFGDNMARLFLLFCLACLQDSSLPPQGCSWTVPGHIRPREEPPCVQGQSRRCRGRPVWGDKTKQLLGFQQQNLIKRVKRSVWPTFRSPERWPAPPAGAPRPPAPPTAPERTPCGPMTWCLPLALPGAFKVRKLVTKSDIRAQILHYNFYIHESKYKI